MTIILTKFMTTTKQNLITRGLAETSATTYIRILHQLNDGPFRSFIFLKDVSAIEAKMVNLALNTRQAYLGSIIGSISSLKDNLQYKPTYNKYRVLLDNAKKSNQVFDTTAMSVNQKKNWMTWDEIVKIRTTLKATVIKFSDQSKIVEKQYAQLLQFITLSLFTESPPRRNKDYQIMLFTKQWNNKMSDKTNYLSYDDKKFVFNVYKSVRQKEGGRQIIPIPEPLIEAIDMYLKYHPLRVDLDSDNYHFLVDVKGNEMPRINDITRILNQAIGSNVGSTLLRHIYLSDKYDVKDMKSDSTAMGHSLSMQRYYLKQPSSASASSEAATALPPQPAPQIQSQSQHLHREEAKWRQTSSSVAS